jgi:hypothetical protein
VVVGGQLAIHHIKCGTDIHDNEYLTKVPTARDYLSPIDYSYTDGLQVFTEPIHTPTPETAQVLER